MGKLIYNSAGVPPTSGNVGIAPTNTPMRPQRRLSFMLLGICLTSLGFAQTPITPKTQISNKETTPTPDNTTTPAKIAPSRYVNEEDCDDYVKSLSAVFSMRVRATDPFGQLQDPNAKPIIKSTAAKTTRRITQVQATPFSDIIKLIKVTTIMPKEQCFLMGTRSIHQGDRIPLLYRSKNIRVEVSSVSSNKIEFRNLENGESASLQLNLLPTGMTPGSGAIATPGMAPDRTDAPIELDPANTPREKISNP